MDFSRYTGHRCPDGSAGKAAGAGGGKHTLIEPYSRFCGRNPGSEQSLLACFSLPRPLWPQAAAAKLDALRSEFAEPLRTLALSELAFKCLEAAGELPSARLTDLATGLEQTLIGMEPDVLAGLGGRKRMTALVCSLDDGPSGARDAEYRKAALAISLAACVALADGQADETELEAAERLMAGWQHLHGDLRTRLRAQYRVQVSHGAGLAALRTRLLALEQPERNEIALDMTRMAAANGVFSPAGGCGLCAFHQSAQGVDQRSAGSPDRSV